METERNLIVDYMRGFGAILVIIGHCFPATKLGHFIYSFHMPLFFFISGYVYKKSTNLIQDVRTIWKRFKLLMIPYFFTRLVFVPLVNYFAMDTCLIDRSYLFEVVFKGYDIWFTYALFWLFVVVVIWQRLLSIAKVNEKVGMLVLMFFCVLIRLLGVLNIGVFAFNRVSYEIVYFIIGYMIKREIAKEKIEVLSNKWIGIASLFILLLINHALPEMQWYEHSHTVWVQYIAALVGIVFAYNLAKCVKTKIISSILRYMGRYSFQYYMLPKFPIVNSHFGSILLNKILDCMINTVLANTLYIEIAKRSKILSLLYGIRNDKKSYSSKVE